MLVSKQNDVEHKNKNLWRAQPVGQTKYKVIYELQWTQ